MSAYGPRIRLTEIKKNAPGDCPATLLVRALHFKRSEWLDSRLDTLLTEDEKKTSQVPSNFNRPTEYVAN